MASDSYRDLAAPKPREPAAPMPSTPQTDGQRATPRALHTAGILERISDGYVALDREWRVVHANQAACRIHQKPLDEFRGNTLWEEWPATVGTEVERRYRRAMADQEEAHFEYFSVRGTRKTWLEIDAYPSDSGLDVFYRDITSRKQAEAELRTFQFLSENANDPFFLMDAEGRFVYVNAAACRVLGYPAEALTTMRVADIDPAYQGDAAYRALFEQAQRETLVPWEASHRRADGTVFPVEISAAGLNAGDQILLFASVRDISERRRAEEERRQSAARQRIFLRDVLASVTNGHLILCSAADELPASLTPVCSPLPLSQTAGLWELREAVRAACEAAGLPPDRCYDLVTAASEAGMNTIVHVGSGTGQVFSSQDCVQVRVTDHGAGIDLENLPHATLRKGFTTAGTLGHGMKMMLCMADRVFLLTSAAGTVVVMEQDRVVPPEDW